MALMYSHMMALGTKAPDFDLLDTVSGTQKCLMDLASEQATVVVFWCNHCPYVKHIQTALVDVARRYQPLGVRMIAISSNDVTAYPEDHPRYMKQVAAQYRYPFPYLYDEDQSVAKAYQAVCTPDFFVFDHQLACVYRGQFDGATPSNGVPVTGGALMSALDALLQGTPMPVDQKPSVGCSIKWR